MTYVEKQIEKIYWSTNDITTMLHVPASKIRYWITTFGIQVREAGGPRDWQRRYYSVQDVEDLKFIYDLLIVKGLKIKAALKLFAHRHEDLSKVGVPMFIA